MVAFALGRRRRDLLFFLAGYCLVDAGGHFVVVVLLGIGEDVAREESRVDGRE